MDFIEEVRIWIEKAKAADPELKVFGAYKHKYEFDPPADISEVRAFEQKHGMKLPENYVRVLTELGNGGAGPDLFRGAGGLPLHRGGKRLRQKHPNQGPPGPEEAQKRLHHLWGRPPADGGGLSAPADPGPEGLPRQRG